MATHRFRRGEKILTPIVDQKQADSSYTSGRQGKDCTAGIHQAAGPRLHSNEQDQTHWEACDLREYARIMGTRVILEAKAPEESQEVEYISDSSEPESPLIKQRAEMETESPSAQMDRNAAKLQGKQPQYILPSPNGPEDSDTNGQTDSPLELYPRRRRATLCAVGLLPTSAVSDLFKFVAGGDHHAQYYLSTSSL